MKEIWIVKASSGQYEDRWEWDVMAFSTEDAAQEYLSSTPKINFQAIGELQRTKHERLEVFYQEHSTDNFTDEQWAEYDDKIEALGNKAKSEVQLKYPDADLTVDEEFNGYFVSGPVRLQE